MKYIDAEKLKAKLGEHYRKYQSKYMETRNPYTQGLIDALDLVEQVISSLQQEQPEGGCSEKPNNFSLPSDLDEAAEKCAIREGYLAGLHYETMKRVFKAGAEWMAGQGVTVGGTFHHSCGYPSVIELNTYLRDYEGKEVIVQIRKKQ